MNTPGQLFKRLNDLEGSPGEQRDIVLHIEEIPPTEDRFIIYHMKGEKFLDQEIMTPEQYEKYKARA